VYICGVIKNNKKMEQRKFENVSVGQTVTFEENGKIESGIVHEVKENTFTLRALRSWDNNGVMSYHDSFFNFYKTGTKSHSHYTYGNAIDITCMALS
jgi:hypothetical protein